MLQAKLSLEAVDCAWIVLDACAWVRPSQSTHCLSARPRALPVTKGFRDLLRIGNQARPDIFDLSAHRPGVLFEEAVEVNERIVPSHPRSDAAALSSYRAIVGTTGETYHVLQELDTPSVTAELRRLKEEGFESVAVALVNSFACPEYDPWRRRMGFAGNRILRSTLVFSGSIGNYQIEVIS